MILCFKLSMPMNNAWNGKWTGDNKIYVRIRKFGKDKQTIEKTKKILQKGYYTYNFGDGWIAGIHVYNIDNTYPKSEPARLQKISAGFCGYDWMIDSIIDYGEILNTKQRKERAILMDKK